MSPRPIEISYRRLKRSLGIVAVVLVGLITIAASWWYMAARASQVPGLERELAELERDQEQVAELARALAEMESQYERVRQILGVEDGPREGTRLAGPPVLTEPRPIERNTTPASIPGAWPLTQSGFITRETTGEAGEPHPGLDIAVPQDAYIRATGAGVVKAAGSDDVYGEYVLIEHADGYESMYGHASRLFVAVGGSVERHEVVALSGSTGRSTAPHLPFEIRKDGRAIDPLPFVRKP
jgi:murein DD-endopeptidase MepM/ murein hydrolase activator NlpD